MNYAVRKKEKVQEDKEAEKSQEVTTAEQVEFDRLSGGFKMAFRYFPEADPRYFRVYQQKDYQREIDQREKEAADAERAQKNPLIFCEALMKKYWDRAAKFCHSRRRAFPQK